jgi:hypothetical protein
MTELYDFSKLHPKLAAHESSHRLLFGHLVAISSSLWPAANFSYKPRDWSDVLTRMAPLYGQSHEHHETYFQSPQAPASVMGNEPVYKQMIPCTFPPSISIQWGHAIRPAASVA